MLDLPNELSNLACWSCSLPPLAHSLLIVLTGNIAINAQLKKYRTISIVLIISMLNGSGVGVRIAPQITLIKIAYLQCFNNIFEFTRPKAESINIAIGKRNVSPDIAKINTVNEIKFSIPMLAEMTFWPKAKRKFIIWGATKKYEKIIPKKNNTGVAINTGIIIFLSPFFNPGKIKPDDCQITTGAESKNPKQRETFTQAKKNSPG